MSESQTALIIEDDDDIRRLLEVVLEQSGFTVQSAPNGTDGIAALSAKASEGAAFTLVTVDIGLPDIDGNEVVRRIRPDFNGVIAVISARSTESDKATALTAGADVFLTKPFRPRIIREQIATALAERN
ncbi:response regulator transcription factor [Humidisolicoccus flavus]|uniref:response regulator transcription factor n=1 Tax=Humidisolicoccus flavus TaxID=3111414 RepID=UPI00324D2C66